MRTVATSRSGPAPGGIGLLTGNWASAEGKPALDLSLRHIEVKLLALGTLSLGEALAAVAEAVDFFHDSQEPFEAVASPAHSPRRPPRKPRPKAAANPVLLIAPDTSLCRWTLWCRPAIPAAAGAGLAGRPAQLRGAGPAPWAN